MTGWARCRGACWGSCGWPRAAALIPLRELRRLTFIAKPEFDAAILALRDAGRIHLHHHDHPVGIAEDERYDLVTDDRGHYYVAAGLL